jgi:zinc transport system substrate-binding protein
MGRVGALLVSIAVAAVSWRQPTAMPLRVVVSLPPQLWLVRSIGGPDVSVSALVGPGESEETYSPTDAQVSDALRARVFFRIGAGFEQAPWFRALSASGRLEVVDTRESADTRAAHDVRPGSDPHVWTSPRRLAEQGAVVAATLARLDPDQRVAYEERLRELRRELEILDAELAATLAPYRGRSFFVFHPSWGHLATDYGLRQISIEVEGKEPTDSDLTRFQELARAEHPRLLFYDAQVPARVAGAVAGTLGASPALLDPLALDVPANLRRVAAKLVESFGR